MWVPRWMQWSSRVAWLSDVQGAWRGWAAEEAVEADCASGSGGTRGPVLIHSSDWAASGLVVRKVKGGDLGVLEFTGQDWLKTKGK